MIGHMLGNLKPASVLEIVRDPGCPEGVAADFGPDAGLAGPPADHPPYVGLDQGIAGQLAGAPPGCPE
jgi:hypothetical protein